MSSVSGSRKVLRSAGGNRIRNAKRTPVRRTSLGFGGSGKKGTDVNDDLDDIPMSYLLYVLLAIVGIVAGAIFVVVKML
jgi:hypothetical protein